MFYAVICTDNPGGLEIRQATRPAHVEYLKSTPVVQAGPFLNADGQMYGSLVIIDVEDRAAAEAWAANDPYAKAGLFAKVRIEAWKRVINSEE